jgi:putative transposase
MCTRRRRDLELTRRICAIHRRSRETYSAPNIHAELAGEHGIRVGRKRVARLTRGNGIRGATLGKCVVTMQSDPETAKPVDLVERRFFDDAPDRLRVADMTYIPTCSDRLYLTMVLDVYSRKVVGWAMDTNMRTELILDALQMAVTQRQPRGAIQHSDRGSQYTSYAFGKRCKEGGIMPSTGSVGGASNNAMAESFFATLEREVLHRRRFRETLIYLRCRSQGPSSSEHRH